MQDNLLHRGERPIKERDLAVQLSDLATLVLQRFDVQSSGEMALIDPDISGNHFGIEFLLELPNKVNGQPDGLTRQVLINILRKANGGDSCLDYAETHRVFLPLEATADFADEFPEKPFWEIYQMIKGMEHRRPGLELSIVKNGRWQIEANRSLSPDKMWTHLDKVADLVAEAKFPLRLTQLWLELHGACYEAKIAPGLSPVMKRSGIL